MEGLNKDDLKSNEAEIDSGTPDTKKEERLKAKAYDLEQKNKILERQLEAARAEKRKPGITAVEEDGTINRRKRPNTSGVSDLMLPPFTKNMVAIYRIIGADGINDATGLKVEPFDVLIPGRYTLYDKFEKDPLKRNKVMQNITGTERIVEDGKAVVREIIDDVLFIRGWLHVPVAEKYALYIFMELHMNNKNNRFRPNNAPIIFERVDIQHKSPAARAAALDLSIDAAIAIRSMKKEDVLAYAQTATPPIDTSRGKQIAEIRAELIRYAMNNPIGFFKQHKNAKASIMMMISDAMMFGLIDFVPEKRAYVYTESEEELHTHLPSEEPMESFIKMLMKEENKEIRQMIEDRLNYWNE